MARHYGKIQTAIWDDDDFLQLSAEAQRVYMLLVTQKDIAMTGVLAFRPRRWSSYCKSSTLKSTERALFELEQARFVVIDEDTEELLLRTFVKHDKVFANEKLIKAFTDSVQEVRSAHILDYIHRGITEDAPDEVRELVDGLCHRASDTPSDRASDEASQPDAQSDVFLKALKLNTEHGSLKTTNAKNVILVFETWQESTGKTKAKLDPKRRKLITDALKEYPLEDVLDAVRGWKQSSYHRGENERRTVYNELHVLLRDATQIEKFRDLERNGSQAPPTTGGTQLDKNLRNLAAITSEQSA